MKPEKNAFCLLLISLIVFGGSITSNILANDFDGTGEIRLQVYDHSTQNPLSFAVVNFTNPSTGQTTTLFTDSDGHVSFPDADSDVHYNVEVIREGYYNIVLQNVNAGNGSTNNLLLSTGLRTEGTSALYGWVQDQYNMRVAGASVDITDANENPVVTVYSNCDGAFFKSDLMPNSTYHYWATKSNFDFTYSSSVTTQEGKAVGGKFPVTNNLTGGGQLKTKVEVPDSFGVFKPAANAKVRVLNFGTAYSGPDGNVTISHIPAGSYDVMVSKQGYDTETEPTSITSGQLSSLEIFLGKKLTGNLLVRVKVVSSDSLYTLEPLAGAAVTQGGGNELKSDSQGEAFYGGLIPGSYSVSISANHYNTTNVTATVTEGETTIVDVILRWAFPNSGNINGVVLNAATNDPIGGVDVNINDGETELSTNTGADGSYSIENVPLQNVFTLTTSKEGFHSTEYNRTVSVEDQTTTVQDILMQPKAQNKGAAWLSPRYADQLNHKTTELNVADFQLYELTNSDLRSEVDPDNYGAAKNGNSVIVNNLNPGRYEITMLDDKNYTYKFRFTVRDCHMTTFNGLATAYIDSGYVFGLFGRSKFGPSGRNSSNSKVRCFGTGWNNLNKLSSDTLEATVTSDGFYYISDIEPDRDYTLEMSCEGYNITRSVVHTNADGSSKMFDLFLAQSENGKGALAGFVEGLYFDEECKIEVINTTEAFTYSDGTYVIENLAPGDYSVVFHNADQSTEPYNVSITAGITSIIHADFPSNFTTGLEEDFAEMLPTDFKLYGAYPNPFNPSTRIEFSLSKSSIIKITIFDILGREVKILSQEFTEAGKHSIQWNGRNNFGNEVSTGTYFYNISVGENFYTGKLMLLK
ncbi:MAG: carboxypeptidase regulatory-like domain-containing protein [Bacteroidetes bacterium]|nr:carboxypeptidase regulatory-like domain-containing protein [Bacteroidota bacterium]